MLDKMDLPSRNHRCDGWIKSDANGVRILLSNAARMRLSVFTTEIGRRCLAV